MKNKFDFHDVVNIVPNKEDLRKANEDEAVVTCMAQNEKPGKWV